MSPYDGLVFKPTVFTHILSSVKIRTIWFFWNVPDSKYRYNKFLPRQTLFQQRECDEYEHTRFNSYESVVNFLALFDDPEVCTVQPQNFSFWQLPDSCICAIASASVLKIESNLFWIP